MNSTDIILNSLIEKIDAFSTLINQNNSADSSDETEFIGSMISEVHESQKLIETHFKEAESFNELILNELQTRRIQTGFNSSKIITNKKLKWFYPITTLVIIVLLSTLIFNSSLTGLLIKKNEAYITDITYSSFLMDKKKSVTIKEFENTKLKVIESIKNNDSTYLEPYLKKNKSSHE